MPYALYAGSAGGSSSGGIVAINANPNQIVAVGTPTVDLSLATVGTATTVGSS